jgi:DNA uptake protein ComE-like DNA-binding protein
MARSRPRIRLLDFAAVGITVLGTLMLTSPAGARGTGGASSDLPGPTLVNINTASADELQTLPDIGSRRAERIIAKRPYAVPEDLITRAILPGYVFNKIRDYITVSPDAQ